MIQKAIARDCLKPESGSLKRQFKDTPPIIRKKIFQEMFYALFYN